MPESGLSAAVALLEAEAGLTFSSAVLLWAGEGRERLRCVAGQGRLDLWFDLSSLTKALCTSVVAMRLWQAGKLDLAEEALPGVTVAHLLSHSSGLPAWLPLAGRREEIIDRAAEAPREAAGRRAVYSDLGFIVLGRLLEQRGGDRLDRLFAPIAAALEAELGFRPIGEVAAVPAAQCAPTRRESPEREVLCGEVHDDNARAMGGVSGHAGLFGTAAGVGKMARGLVDAFHDEDTGPRRALGLAAETVRRFWQKTDVPGSTWGLGWDHPGQPGGGDAAVSSAGSRWPRDGVGHLGFTGCSLWIDPGPGPGPRQGPGAGQGSWAVLLSNRVDMPTTAAATEAQRRIKALRPLLHDALWQDRAGK